MKLNEKGRDLAAIRRGLNGDEACADVTVLVVVWGWIAKRTAANVPTADHEAQRLTVRDYILQLLVHPRAEVAGLPPASSGRTLSS